MKKFKDFIKKNPTETKVIVDYSDPVHGSHAHIEKTVITKTDKKLKESVSDGGPLSNWLQHEDNSHISGEGSHNESSIFATNKALHAHHDMTKLPQEQHDAVYDYTSGSGRINRNLVKKAKDGTPLPEHHEEKVGLIDKTINAHSAPHDLHVYSGMGRNRTEAVRTAARTGSTLHLPAYTSTSIDKRIANQFSGMEPEEMGDARHHHVLHIHVKKGQRGFHVGSHGNFSNESEFLLPRDTKLKIHPTPDVYSNRHNDNKHFVWHATIQD